MIDMTDFIITFEWETKTSDYTGRVGAQYCFKHCDVNEN